MSVLVVEPWTALIATLTGTLRAPRPMWPDSHRRIVRRLGGWSDAVDPGLSDPGFTTEPSTLEQIVEVLKNGPMTLDDLVKAIGRSHSTVAYRLTQLRRRRQVEPIGNGRWKVT